jgi:hypothetical protein
VIKRPWDLVPDDEWLNQRQLHIFACVPALPVIIEPAGLYLSKHFLPQGLSSRFAEQYHSFDLTSVNPSKITCLMPSP